MNSDKSWILNCGSSLREKEEDFDNLYCESSKPSVEYHELGSQDSNNVKTMMNLQACIGKRCLHDAGKTRPPRKAAAAAAVAAATSMSVHPRQSSTTEKKRTLREDRIWTMLDLHLQKCLLRHHDRRRSKEARATYWDVILPVLRKGKR